MRRGRARVPCGSSRWARPRRPADLTSAPRSSGRRTATTRRRRSVRSSRPGARDSRATLPSGASQRTSRPSSADERRPAEQLVHAAARPATSSSGPYRVSVPEASATKPGALEPERRERGRHGNPAKFAEIADETELAGRARDDDPAPASGTGPSVIARPIFAKRDDAATARDRDGVPEPVRSQTRSCASSGEWRDRRRRRCTSPTRASRRA